MHSWDMLVETPLSCGELDDRNVRVGREAESQCTFCGVSDLDPWFPVSDVMVVRHWNADSVDEPGGGHWTLYCPEHFANRDGRWWANSRLAPERLLPDEVHHCSEPVGLGARCGEGAYERFDDSWLCDRHAAAERVRQRLERLLASE